ncbi:NAD(P)/FAD-dependent oxidoreductase [Ureibacillus manganicus]|uniref:Ferredoxin--NADP reductase n=1 Tax=Ureibacillus manganicus DSM 26584 TaxID=1384049 RepID=A0A0A3IPH7_9BACL|nr:NAD(P)/FAD-dependent oxidoreductase [Ureibacillus manganicus]KGR76742.1 ferredoxin-NADP reductase [Ureibacillus manganicus DSM 26584]
MSQNEEVYDITIIGGGPIGLFTAFYAGMRQCSVKIIESLPQLGGQLSALYPEKFIYDIPAFPKVRAQDIIDNLIEQMNHFEQTICLGQAIESVEKLEDGSFKLTTNTEVHYTKTIIITAGNGAFQPRKLQLDDSERFESTNMHYFIKDMNKFEGKRVCVLGGGDSAVDWALMLEPVAKEVSLVHRRNEFRAHENSVENLKNSHVQIMTPYVPVELVGDERIEKIVLQEVKNHEKVTLEVDDLIVNYGFLSSLGPIKNWGLELEKNSIVVNSKMETNIPGIFAAGDICTYEGKAKLIVTGFGEAPIAVSSAKLHFDPSAKRHMMHSTSLMDELKK